jgi:hypothetical protein
MDRARQRFANNVQLLRNFNDALSVMGDRDWTNACENSYIQHMAKKLWMHDFTPEEVRQVDKAVRGYLAVLNLRAQANPVVSGGRVVKGEIFSVKEVCDDHDPCGKHWKMNVRDHIERYAIYTPIPPEILDEWDPQDLVGRTVSYYAYLTASERDPSFGFAHRPKLMTISEEN